MSFQIGDVVKLKGGGPLMTVTGTSTGPGRPPLFTCNWFDKDDREQSSSFPGDALIKPEAKKPVKNSQTTANTRKGSGSDWMR